jgi:hypothetical protein
MHLSTPNFSERSYELNQAWHELLIVVSLAVIRVTMRINSFLPLPHVYLHGVGFSAQIAFQSHTIIRRARKRLECSVFQNHLLIMLCTESLSVRMMQLAAFTLALGTVIFIRIYIF